MQTSEDVLYQIAHVKYKKDVGTLYVMCERICWIQKDRDIVTLTHNYADIKSQKISSEGKPKIQLQIILHETNATYTFQFVDPSGQQKQIESRNLVVEYLRQVLPKYGRGVDSEMVEKRRLLNDNAVLFQLYKDLVTDGIVTPEEFWKVHAEPYVNKNKPNNTSQEVGVSSGFLSGIQPLTDGLNGITYNLTPEIMESIFKTYPAVRRKHFECVPAQMTESEFWIKFFQSHYFHRDRLPSLQDLFSDCAKADDKEMRRALERLKQKDSEVLNALEDPGHHDINKELMNAGPEKQDFTSVGIHRNMIKRFNQHSIMVLNACERNNEIAEQSKLPKAEREEGKKRKKKNLQPDLAEPAINGNHVAAQVVPDEPEAKKIPKIPDSFEELSSETAQHFQKLNLTKIDRYLNGPIPDYKTDQVSNEQVLHTIQSMRECLGRWGGKPQLLESKTAVNMLGELNPGGLMMKGSFSENVSQSLTTEVETELRNTYVALAELLRHFWSCFPPTTTALQEKLLKTHDTIKKFEQVKLQRLADDLKRDHLDPGFILGHMYAILEAANLKYNQWATRRR